MTPAPHPPYASSAGRHQAAPRGRKPLAARCAATHRARAPGQAPGPRGTPPFAPTRRGRHTRAGAQATPAGARGATVQDAVTRATTPAREKAGAVDRDRWRPRVGP
jgi:hypothetical protein